MDTKEKSLDKAQDKCGIFGVVNRASTDDGEISKIVYTGLFQLQHRGRESAGISAWREGEIFTHKGMGTIDAAFGRQVSKDEGEFNVLNTLNGACSIGHVRYSTTGASGKENIQPIEFSFYGKDVAIGHNGNIETGDLLEIIDERGGYKQEDTTDTGLIAALIATSEKSSFLDALIETLELLKGAFSLIVMHEGRIYAIKDKFGIRPLCVGMTDDYFFAASETRALDNFRAHHIEELAPGTIAVLDPSLSEPSIVKWTNKTTLRRCMFEDVYFSMPDSLGAGNTRIMMHRKALGAAAAREHPIMDADVVMPVLDSGLFQGIGYAQELEMIFHERDIEVPIEGLFQYAFIRGRVERTFMEPIADVRKLLQDLKFSIVPEIVRDKHVVVVDDSIVRGNVMPYIVERLRSFGAKKVSVIIPLPPLRHPCHLGVDLPYREEYIAHDRSLEEVAELIGADYLGYLSIKGLYGALKNKRENFCDGCLTNEYPVPLPEIATYKPKEEE